jgi:hypothetical protein
MAQRLQPKDSADKCINIGNRHIRLCNQMKGTEFLVVSIKPAITACSTKQKAVSDATEATEVAHDTWVFTDSILDTIVKNTASRCKEFDRSNPGASNFASIFPKGIEVITRETREDEPDVVDKLAVRIEALGSAHELFPNAAKLREAAQKSRDAHTTYKELSKTVDTLKVELEITKSELIDKYIANMLDAEKAFGRDYANRLFPILRSSDSSSDDSDETPKQSSDETKKKTEQPAEESIAR